MKNKLIFFAPLATLFYCGFLSLRLIITLFFLVFDDYYSKKNYKNIELIGIKDFQLSFYTMVIPFILIVVTAIIIARKIKKNYLIIISALIVSLLLFRFSYLEIFKFFSFTTNSFLNIGILFIPLSILIVFSCKYLMRIMR